MNGFTTKGISHVSLPVATVGTVLIAVVAALAAYYGTVNSQTITSSGLNTRISVVESKQSADESTITSMQSNIQYIHDQVIRISSKLGVNTYQAQ